MGLSAFAATLITMQTRLTRAALERELRAAGSPERAAGAAKYFKTGPGEYGEGDLFIGVTVPVVRKIALRYKTLGMNDLDKLLTSKIHEFRSAALEILVARYRGGDDMLRKQIVDFYLAHTACINNWDLVDMSARDILGHHLLTRQRKLLVRLARSESLWERRIAIIATMKLVNEGEFEDALDISERLLDDKHDLIHKAVGWVLRVVGDKDRAVLLGFLQKHHARLPRTTLRYAIEHFTSKERKLLLAGTY